MSRAGFDTMTEPNGLIREPPGHWICRVASGPEAGKEFGLGTRPVIIGAGVGCDVILNDPKISRRHAELQMTSQGVRVVDLGSTNGTYYQSSRLTEVVVPPNAVVRLGDTALQFLLAAPPAIQASERRRFGGLVGASLAMREVFAVLELASPTDSTVLIEGESGSGKELTARALHDHSKRATRPFVIVDCGATHEQLIDSQLFGHVRGAFTGAVSDRKGAFVEASGGTLFLDEVGELPLASQMKLLRALEAHTVTPVGSDRPVSVDARVVAATNRDLYRMVEEKTFRFDLYYRLAVVHICIPPLRDRVEDIPELIRLFYEGRGVESGGLGGENLQILLRHNWPGNVRELRNVLERAWVLSGASGTEFERLRFDLRQQARSAPSEAIDTTLPFKEAKERWLDAFERRYLEAVFAAHNKNISSTAEHAGINRNHVRKLLLKYGLIDQ
jgi:DNA-binding NtrC family response regulator